MRGNLGSRVGPPPAVSPTDCSVVLALAMADEPCLYSAIHAALRTHRTSEETVSIGDECVTVVRPPAGELEDLVVRMIFDLSLIHI